jgi:hypothetical protein
VLFEQDVKVTVDETTTAAITILRNVFILKTGFWFKTSGKGRNNCQMTHRLINIFSRLDFELI